MIFLMLTNYCFLFKKIDFLNVVAKTDTGTDWEKGQQRIRWLDDITDPHGHEV